MFSTHDPHNPSTAKSTIWSSLIGKLCCISPPRTSICLPCADVSAGSMKTPLLCTLVPAPQEWPLFVSWMSTEKVAFYCVFLALHSGSKSRSNVLISVNRGYHIGAVSHPSNIFLNTPINVPFSSAAATLSLSPNCRLT